MTKGPGYN